MKKTHDTFDWVGAALALAQADTNDIGELVRAAGLDPMKGDLACADFSGLDLSNQNMEGWNLEQATWRDTNVAGANLKKTILRADNFIQAQTWRAATLSRSTIKELEDFEKQINISLDINIRTSKKSELIMAEESIKESEATKRFIDLIADLLSSLRLKLGIDLKYKINIADLRRLNDKSETDIHIEAKCKSRVEREKIYDYIIDALDKALNTSKRKGQFRIEVSSSI